MTLLLQSSTTCTCISDPQIPLFCNWNWIQWPCPEISPYFSPLQSSLKLAADDNLWSPLQVCLFLLNFWMVHTYLILQVLPGRELILFVDMPRRIISQNELGKIQHSRDRYLDHTDTDVAESQGPLPTGRKPRWSLLGLSIWEFSSTYRFFFIRLDNQLGQMSFLAEAAPMHNFSGQDLDFTQCPKHRSNVSCDKTPKKALLLFIVPLNHLEVVAKTSCWRADRPWDQPSGLRTQQKSVRF